MTEELRPCPFCGNSVELNHYQARGFSTGDRSFTVIHCESCKYEYAADTPFQIERWQRRPIDDTLKSAYRWIPVSEKLPEGDMPVLVLDATVTPPQFSMAKHRDWGFIAPVYLTTITHWAAMPPLTALLEEI